MRRKWIALVVAAAVVLTAAAVLIVRGRGDGPDDVVRRYLEAARRGDVAGALAAAGVDDPPRGASAELLGASVPPVAFQIGAITEPYNMFGDVAEVAATITDGITAAKGRFELVERDGRWRISRPFAVLKVAGSAVRGVRVNGRALPAGGEQQVLPGFYEPVAAPDDPMVRAVTPRRIAALPRSGPLLFPQDFTPTAAAREQFQQAADAYLNRCLTDPACRPYSERYESPGVGYPGDDEVREAVWRVVRPPRVDLPGTVGRDVAGEVTFTGQVTVPGVLRVDAVAAEGPFSMTCLVQGPWDYALKAWVDDRGLLRTGWAGRDPRIKVRCDSYD